MEINRPVEILRLTMIQNGEAWDAHAEVGVRSPHIRLGTVVLPEVKTPQELKERLLPAICEFVEGLQGQMVEVQH